MHIVDSHSFVPAQYRWYQRPNIQPYDPSKVFKAGRHVVNRKLQVRPDVDADLHAFLELDQHRELGIVKAHLVVFKLQFALNDRGLQFLKHSNQKWKYFFL